MRLREATPAHTLACGQAPRGLTGKPGKPTKSCVSSGRAAVAVPQARQLTAPSASASVSENWNFMAHLKMQKSKRTNALCVGLTTTLLTDVDL